MSFYLSYDTIVSLNLACDHYQGLSTQDGGVDFNTPKSPIVMRGEY